MFVSSTEVSERIFTICLLQWSLVVVLCFVAFIVLLFRQREHALAVVAIGSIVLCFPGLLFGVLAGLGYGWWKAKSWHIVPFMTFWTIFILVWIVNFGLWIVSRVRNESF